MTENKCDGVSSAQCLLLFRSVPFQDTPLQVAIEVRSFAYFARRGLCACRLSVGWWPVANEDLMKTSNVLSV